MQHRSGRRAATIVAGIAGIIAVAGIGYRLATAGSMAGLIDTLGYFTIQSNLAVIAVLVASILIRRSTEESVRRERIVTAVGLYIVITGVVYQTMLARDLDPAGVDRIVLQINHGVTPLLYLLWFALRPKTIRLNWRDTPRFLIYPLVYGGLALIEGRIKGAYRYPFLDVEVLGVDGVVFWVVVVATVFAWVGLGLIALNRVTAAPEKPQTAATGEDL